MGPLKMPKNYKVNYFFCSRNPNCEGFLVVCISNNSDASSSYFEGSTTKVEQRAVVQVVIPIMRRSSSGKWLLGKDVAIGEETTPYCLSLDHPCKYAIAVAEDVKATTRVETKMRLIFVDNHYKFHDIWVEKLL